MGFATDITRWFVDDLDRGSRGGKGSWLAAVFGVLTAIFGVVGPIVEGPHVGAHYLLLGSAFVTMRAAELVSGDRIGLARNLRIGSWIAFVLFVAWVFGRPFLAASFRVQGVATAGLLMLVGFGWLLHTIFSN